MSKKSAETMLTRLETTSGRLAVSAMKPAAMTKASVAAGVKPSATSIAMTIGVRISAAPSLANKAETAAPSSTISANSQRPCPPPQRATCSAAHSKKPASSSSRLTMMTAMKVAVAFQTMPHTTGTSAGCTTPVASASAAPMAALQPMPRPRGCQMTSTSVPRKMRKAVGMEGRHERGRGGRTGAGGRAGRRISPRRPARPARRRAGPGSSSR